MNPGLSEAATQSSVRPRAMGVILSVASCLIVGANLLVAAALLRLLLRKCSQSWCFVLNLALADALVGVAITGLATEDFQSGEAGSGRRAGLPGAAAAAPGRTRCLLRMALVTSPCTASIFSMFLISLDRYAAIKMPLRYSRLSGRGTVATALAALWAASLLMGFLPVMVRQLQAEGFRGSCAFFSVIDPGRIIVLFSVCFFPVLCVFVYIYLDILKIACSHHRQIFQIRQAGSRSAGGAPQRRQQHPRPRPHPPPPQQQQQQQQQARSRYWSHVKALRTVAMLVGCFLLLWCPFFVVSMVQLLCEHCRLIGVLENYLWLLGLCNSLINPLLYAYWQREVRQQLAAIFSRSAGGASDAAPPPPPPPPPAQAAAGDSGNPTQPLSVTTSL